MSAGMPTLLDLAKIDAGVAYPIIQESVKICPELTLVPADTIEGNSMQLTVRTGLPDVSFRNFNEGTSRSKPDYETRTFQAHTLDHQVAIDRAIVDAAKDRGRVMEAHAVAALESSLRLVGEQFYYGTGQGNANKVAGKDSKGFPGLLAQYKADSDHEVDAAGTTNLSSVWFLRLGRETLEFIFGNGITIQMADEWLMETVLDSNNKPFQAWVNWLRGSVGLRLANKNAAVRIKNLSDATNKTLNDDLMNDAYVKFTELGFEPTHIFMTGRSLNQLRKSRTNTGSNEKGVPPELPKDWMGIPIIRTSSIRNAE